MRPGAEGPGGEPPGVAVFDFDATLTRRDTLMGWLVALAGRRRVAGALTAAVAGTIADLGRGRARADQRTRFKETLFCHLIAGTSEAEAAAAAERMRPGLRWRDDMLAAFQDHRRAGDVLVIATGSPRLVVERLAAERCAPDLVIGTELETDGHGRLTGRLAGPNCVREDKAQRVGDWLAAQGPIGRSYGYGNHPHDRPMLALVDHPRVV